MNKKTKRSLSVLQGYIYIVTGIFITLIIVLPISSMFIMLIGKPSLENIPLKIFPIVYLMHAGIVSLLLGSVLLWFIMKKLLNIAKLLINGFDKVSKGDFSVRINTHNFAELGDSFNVMVEELSSVELFRSKFINQFSHEFKTPINSIHGFASLLKDPLLSEEEKNEYIDIIIEESKRLSSLSTNILNLSKVENQLVLSDKTDVNISEQIRRVIILLEKQWTCKNLEFVLELEEITSFVNADLMIQLWLNLIGNSIKFSDEYGEIKITLKKHEDIICFNIENSGAVINNPDKIYDRFYQDDVSHSTKGNGLGLSIVKKIIELHGGEISLDTNQKNNDMTIFKVILPP